MDKNGKTGFHILLAWHGMDEKGKILFVFLHCNEAKKSVKKSIDKEIVKNRDIEQRVQCNISWEDWEGDSFQSQHCIQLEKQTLQMKTVLFFVIRLKLLVFTDVQ